MDDEEANRLAIRGCLENAGCAVIEAEDGVEALELARAMLPSLIVMDIQMPRCDGYDATRAIRESAPPLCDVPILLYSATPLSDAELNRRGMDGRVPKPCSDDQLIAALEPWLVVGGMASVERLAGIFGEVELGRVVMGLRDQLVSAVEELGNTAIPASAHRIAGAAGTLGFAAVSASWLALSEGDETARDRARRDARLAIAAIERREQIMPDH